MPASNSCKSQKQQQLHETCELLCKGYTRAHIIEHFKTKWTLKRGAADLMIAKANKRLAEINEGSIEKAQALVLQGLWKQYRNAGVANDHNGAAKILVEIAKLKGLDHSTVHLKIDRPLQELSDEELAKALSDSKE